MQSGISYPAHITLLHNAMYFPCVIPPVLAVHGDDRIDGKTIRLHCFTAIGMHRITSSCPKPPQNEVSDLLYVEKGC